MSPEVIVAGISAVAAILGGLFSYRSSTRATAVERSKVDAEAYQRAKEFYESALDTMEDQLRQVRERLDVVTNQLTQEQDSSIALRRQVRELQAQLAVMEQTVADLRVQLSRSGISLSDPAGSPAGDQTRAGTSS